MSESIEVYSGDDLAVFDYRCTGAIGGRDAEELASEHSVVMPRAGTFVRHDAAGSFVADSTQAVFFHKGAPFQVSHPVNGGDLCTVFAPSPRLHAELMRWHGPPDDADTEASFPFDWLPLRGQPHLRQRILFHSLETGGRMAPLEFEERVLDFLGNVVGQAYLTKARTGARHPADGPLGARELTHQAKLVLGERMMSKVTLG